LCKKVVPVRQYPIIKIGGAIRSVREIFLLNNSFSIMPKKEFNIITNVVSNKIGIVLRVIFLRLRVSNLIQMFKDVPIHIGIDGIFLLVVIFEPTR
jgi:hypothetical protein